MSRVCVSLYRRALRLHILFPIVLLLTYGMSFVSSALADAAPPPDPTVGGAVPYQPIQTMVQMMSETVLIDVPPQPVLGEPRQIHVDANFTMRNQGRRAEQMQVIFPLTRLNSATTEEAVYELDRSSFTVKVDGVPARITEMTTPPELAVSDMDHGYIPEVRWAAFEVSFPVQQVVLLDIQYNMLNGDGIAPGFTGVAYILETGAGWYGSILTADVTVRLPYPIRDLAISTSNPNYETWDNEMRWHFEDFEPTRQDNLEIQVNDLTAEYNLRGLLSRVEKDPSDSAAWTGLAQQYEWKSIRWRDSYLDVFDDDYARLSVEARRRIVELQPGSADAHYQLARILWLTNPDVRNTWNHADQVGRAEAPSPDDPSIQEIVNELQLAWSMGSREKIPYMDAVYPGLVLPEEITSTATFVPAGTATAAEASTIVPVVLSSATPGFSHTPSALPTAILIAATMGLLIVGGLYVYLWRPRRRQRR